jgi:hypothetical protein
MVEQYRQLGGLRYTPGWTEIAAFKGFLTGLVDSDSDEIRIEPRT